MPERLFDVNNKIRKDPCRPALAGCTRTLLVAVLIFLVSAGCAKNNVTYSPGTSVISSQSPAGSISARDALKAFYDSWQGVPYRYGGMSRSAIDCSGLALLAYRELYGLQLPRTVAEQARRGTKVSGNSFQPGDLVFFKTGVFQRHVGIFLEKSQFIHASTSRGVMISRLDEPYWDKNFWKATRIHHVGQTVAH